MFLRSKWGELIVPAIVLLGCLLFWFHIQEARSVTRRIPEPVIVLTVLTTLIILMRTVFQKSAGKDEADAALPDQEAAPTTKREILIRVAFLILCVGYYFSFGSLGFSLTNLLFLLLAYPLVGLGPIGTAVGAVVSSLTFHFLAWVMNFNVPVGPLGF
ncbi:hypothetical protein PZ897_10905 [Hoeflea sp. YIM 152468]|uniref:hypothetical protein n=1 Tax=Hoeflea sp. YIM 152468 TaxID=3031759 RepID=UPI0023DA9806|nr:hypothetical protein [Hoeflea sp. YIM 152468]MDF1608686.1 hypothetical protein [Hoeflea sp. YIM 152468]